MLLLLVRAPQAHAAPVVKVRVIGESSTLLPLTTVTLEKPEPVSECPADSANAAINLAVGGNWDHGEEEGSKGDFTKTILGETHEFTREADTWAVWIDDKWAGGICEDMLSEGDEVLVIADHEPEPAFAPTVLPLVLANVPQTVLAGAPFQVTVGKVHTRPGTFAEVGEGTAAPEPGVSVSGGGASGQSDASGIATLALATPGSYALIATEPGAAPSAPVQVCVRASDELTCGSGPSKATAAAGVSASTTRSLPYTGPYALVAHLSSVLNGRVYAPGRAPRVLAGTISAHSPVASVSLRLRREYRHRCYAYDGLTTRFARTRCGKGSFFKVAGGASFSYLLPAVLRPGRYVLDVRATDAAGNSTTLARGTSRIVFEVRR
ncbi:MAG TPA: hypothetical protein VMG62_07485 [Solirubrobacteraceae bacterium]|nr:hypothetical protein [Solirubrobacteraceae bacterium]